MTRPDLTTIRIAAVLLVATAIGTGSARAQSESSIVNAIGEVADWLDEGWDLVPGAGEWGLVFGWFAEGEEKTLTFDAEQGETYMIAGGGADTAEDLDICVYDANGEEVGCDVLDDNFPLVTFRAESSGTYRAVLTAYAVDGPTTHAGMALLWHNP